MTYLGTLNTFILKFVFRVGPWPSKRLCLEWIRRCPSKAKIEGSNPSGPVYPNYFAADLAPQASQTIVESCFDFSRCVSGLLHTGHITRSFRYLCSNAENDCLSGRPMKIALPFSIDAFIARLAPEIVQKLRRVSSQNGGKLDEIDPVRPLPRDHRPWLWQFQTILGLSSRFRSRFTNPSQERAVLPLCLLCFRHVPTLVRTGIFAF